MEKRSPVPRFGNWEGEEDVPYTAYFEKARTDKGNRMMDTRESQVQAPTLETVTKPKEIRSKHEHRTSREGVEVVRRLTDSPLHLDTVTDSSRQHHSSLKSGSSKAAELEGPKSSDNGLGVSTEPALHHDSVGHTTAADWPHQRHGGISPPKRTIRQSAGSSIEHSPLHPYNHQARLGGRGSGAPSPSRERKSSSEGSHGFAPSSPWRARLRSVTRGGDETPDQGAAVPKFGDWDETNPSSADGYSAIFSKAREERQSGAGKVPVMPTESSHSNGQQYTTSDSKKCFCFPWGRK